MSLMPIDWENRPRKHCFAPCPPGVYCECSERMKYEARKRMTDLIDAKGKIARIPKMKMDQIAFYASNDVTRDNIKKLFGLSDAEWIKDVVTAKSLFPDGTFEINVAELEFNYCLGIELEILRYTSGRNWHSVGRSYQNPLSQKDYTPGFISHIGIHLDDGEEFPKMEGCPLVQETFTESHTSEYLTTGAGKGRKYHYRIFQLSPGSYIKYIRRLHQKGG